jgi:YVTN family beta-propeller protein
LIVLAGLKRNVASRSMWVSNVDDGTVSQVSIRSGSLVRNITVGSAPKGLAFDGTAGIWVCNSGSNTVSRIDVFSGTVTDTVSVGTTPVDVAWDHASHVYVACGGNNTVHRIGVTSKVVDLVISVNCGTGMAWDGAAHMHVTHAAGLDLSRILISTGAVDGNLVGAPAVRAITWDHNGFVWYCKSTPEATQRLAISTYDYAGEMPSSPMSNWMAWEDTGHIWATHYSGVVVVENVAAFTTAGAVTLEGTAQTLQGIAWDGGQYLYVCDTRASAVAGSNHVYRIDRATNAVTAIDLGGSSGASRVGSFGICSDAVTI